VSDLIEAFKDSNEDVHYMATLALGKIGPASVPSQILVLSN